MNEESLSELPPPTIRLPGYQCQLSHNSVEHSKIKLKNTANDLVRQQEAHSACRGFQIMDKSKILTIPCESEKETLNYRCSCSFQMIPSSKARGLQYAMRMAKRPIPLGGDYFPIATRRIQCVMRDILFTLNSDTDDMNLLRTNLASVSFDSSWNEEDCIVTFNYNQPIGVTSTSIITFKDGKNEVLTHLIKQAETLLQECKITTLILRSKKKKIIIGRTPSYLSDEIQIFFNTEGNGKFSSTSKKRRPVKASIVPVSQNVLPTTTTLSSSTAFVRYHKPEDAFQHPNGTAMITTLNCMLEKLYTITSEFHTIRNEVPDDDHTLRLLEMYSGCGAHTIAIAKTGMFDAIVAVEIDKRLVDACKENCRLNGCLSPENDDNNKEVVEENICVTEALSEVHVFQGDAREWADKSLLRCRKKKSYCDKKENIPNHYWQNQEYHVLLVDPPRNGLDEKVCELARNGSFQHILYVSCGRLSLKKDLVALNSCFEVVSCTLIDLFPRTDSVETLVHLKRY